MSLDTPRAARSFFSIFFAVALLACSDDESTAPPPGGCGDGTSLEASLVDGLPAECNPLRASGVCLLPFPSAIFLEPDPSTETGQRVTLTPAMFPKNNFDVAFDPVRMNEADGFSPSAEIIAYFPERLDAESLPPLSDPAKSLQPSSATVIVDMESGERVAHFSELDAQVQVDTDRQTLILRPVTRLAANRRYAVAVTRATRTLAGCVPAAPPGWRAIMDGTATEPTAARQAARMPDITSALEKAGVPRAELVLAWDFVTASDASLTRKLRAMRDRTLELLGDAGLGYTIASVDEDFSEHVLRRVKGTFKVPRFLSETDITIADTKLLLGDDGLPVDDGTYDAPFTLIVPRSASAAAPAKLLLFGHGFLGEGESELGDAGGSYLQTLADEYNYAIVATNWVGLSKFEGLDGAGSGAASYAVQDLNTVPFITDRLHQAIVNAMTLARTARGALASDPVLFVGGAQAIDVSRIDYFGISLGGVLGSVLMGFSPDLERGVLNVGGAGWSTLLQRSTNWALFKLLLEGSYPDRLDQQLLVEIFQAHFDPVDGLSIAPHVLADPLEGNPAKRVLLQMSVDDASVPNAASTLAARTLGLKLLDDSPIDVFGLEPVAGPLESAFTVWDTKQTEVPPSTNTSLDPLTKNDAHLKARGLPALKKQIDHFLRMGEVISTCDGPCDPE